MQGVGRRHVGRAGWGTLLAALVLSAATAWRPAAAADDPPEPPPAVAAPEAGDEPPAEVLALAVIRGQRVNVRVGPRVDVRAVTQLDEGAVLLVVERVPGWVGVRIPAGFPAAVAGTYVEAVGEEAVRVAARALNLRVHPPEEGRPLPGAFRERVPRGALLTVLRRDGGWVWVLAPEEVRAYVSADYVQELGPVEEHQGLLEAARRERADRLATLLVGRREAAARRSGERLREAIGAAQQGLYRLRIEGGWERTPVVALANALDAALEACPESPVAVRKLAHALRSDLEAEIELRVARKDAEVARLRGLAPSAEPPPPPAVILRLRGEIRWEAAPTWRNGGAFVLWVEGEPTHVLRLTTGLPQPVPDLAANAGQGPRTVEGQRVDDKVFGLPVVEVRAILP